MQITCSLLSAQCKCQVQPQLINTPKCSTARTQNLISSLFISSRKPHCLAPERRKHSLSLKYLIVILINPQNHKQSHNFLFSVLSTYAVPRRHCLLDSSSLAAKMSRKQITVEDKTKQSLLKYLVDAQRKALDRQMSR